MDVASIYTRGDDGTFYVGLKNTQVFAQEIDGCMASGRVARICAPVLIREGQELWLTPRGNLWVADAKDPCNDSNAVRVQTAPSNAGSFKPHADTAALRLAL
jgi:hypothetical protein